MDKLDKSAGNEWRAPDNATSGYWVKQDPETGNVSVTRTGASSATIELPQTSYTGVAATRFIVVLEGKPIRGGSIEWFEDVSVDNLGARLRVHGITNNTVIVVTDRNGNEVYRAKAGRTRYEIGYRPRTRCMVHYVSAK